MPTKTDTFCIGVQCFVISKDSLLLGLRTAGFGTGTWGLLGGHLEKGETIFQAATRELLEETGIITNEKSLEVITIGDPISENNYHMQIGILVKEWEGAPSIVAQQELGKLEFFPFNNLPLPLLISSEYIIKKYLHGNLY